MLKIMLKNKNCAYSVFTIRVQVCVNKPLLTLDNLERLFYQGVLNKWQQQNTQHIVLDNDCSIRVYHLLQLFNPILLALNFGNGQQLYVVQLTYGCFLLTWWQECKTGQYCSVFAKIIAVITLYSFGIFFCLS